MTTTGTAIDLTYLDMPVLCYIPFMKKRYSIPLGLIVVLGVVLLIEHMTFEPFVQQEFPPGALVAEVEGMRDEDFAFVQQVEEQWQALIEGADVPDVDTLLDWWFVSDQTTLWGARPHPMDGFIRIDSDKGIILVRVSPRMTAIYRNNPDNERAVYKFYYNPLSINYLKNPQPRPAKP